MEKTYVHPVNPFVSPYDNSGLQSSDSSIFHSRSTSSDESINPSRKRRFRSYRLRGEYAQPWLNDKRMNRVKYSNVIVYGFTILGFVAAGLICFQGYKTVVTHDYCMVLDEGFKTLDTENTWKHLVQVDGFGTGSFDWTTTDPSNSYVDAQGLHIVPTLTSETTTITSEQMTNGYTLNLTTDGTCTGDSKYACGIRSNLTTGHMIPPIRSARLSTQGKKSILYGKVEVIAKMPKGDWLWPAIWMMPEDSKYGVWPRSGEIDICETRGNDPGYVLGGRDTFATTLHWGPSASTDSYWRTGNSKQLRRTDFSKDFHKFGLEWSEKYLFTYLDDRIYSVLWVKFEKVDMWTRGEFATKTDSNNTYYANPWANTGNLNSPFDQKFHLILNVAVGGTNGWFPDGEGGKPWVDGSSHAPLDFWTSADQWLPTWAAGPDRGMTVKSVKMWQQGRCI